MSKVWQPLLLVSCFGSLLVCIRSSLVLVRVIFALFWGVVFAFILQLEGSAVLAFLQLLHAFMEFVKRRRGCVHLFFDVFQGVGHRGGVHICQCSGDGFIRHIVYACLCLIFVLFQRVIDCYTHDCCDF